jgi:hypothetical protein
MSIVDEFRGASFSDSRLATRLETIVEGLSHRASLSFPDAARSASALEGTYRFLANDKVTPEQVFAPHLALTRARTKGREVYVAHDTTEFRFKEREGMGRLSSEAADGFLCHASLVVEPGEARNPLGVVSLYNWTRPTRKTVPKSKNHHTDHIPPESRESKRWFAQVEASEERIGDEASLIHLMDSEADTYPLLSKLTKNEYRFVVRLHVNRRVVDKTDASLDAKLEGLSARFFREVTLAPRDTRTQDASRRNPPRGARDAELHVSASRVTLAAPSATDEGLPSSLTLNVVRVFEVNPPKGNAPIEWRLATTEPIRTKQDLEKIVDAYRSRWTIEEFFKALKTGCAFEKRQLASYDALLKALAIFAPIAYELLRLRSAARQTATVPANTFFRLRCGRCCNVTRIFTARPTQPCATATSRLQGSEDT